MRPGSSQSRGSTSPADARRAEERSRPKPTERAFVVQFDPIDDPRSRLRGRVELVASGEATRFRSLKQLVGFMVETLRKRIGVEPSPAADRKEDRT